MCWLGRVGAAVEEIDDQNKGRRWGCGNEDEEERGGES